MIKEFSASHIQEVFEISNSSFQSGWTLSMFLDELKQNNRLNFVYILDNKAIGYCFAVLGLDTLEILDVAVLKEYRNKGIASKLISHIESIAKKQNTDIIYMLEVSENNLPAQKLYEKLGYKKVHTRKDYYGKNNSAFIMEKK